MARPSGFNQEIADLICERLIKPESLRSICLEEGMPSKTTVFRWLEANEEFRDQYARAREFQADVHVDEIIDIADTPVIGEKTKSGADGKTETMTGDMIEHRRLQVDTRKWIASKMRPKKYGDKLDVEHAGMVVVIGKEDSGL